MLLDLDSGLPDRLAGPNEVPRQAECEVLDLTHRRFFGEGEHGVLLSVRGEDVAVVAAYVGGFKVTGETDADAEISDLVAVIEPRDSKQPSLCLAIAVVAKDDVHGSAAPGGRVAERGEAKGGVGPAVGVFGPGGGAELGGEPR